MRRRHKFSEEKKRGTSHLAKSTRSFLSLTFRSELDILKNALVRSVLFTAHRLCLRGDFIRRATRFFECLSHLFAHIELRQYTCRPQILRSLIRPCRFPHLENRFLCLAERDGFLFRNILCGRFSRNHFFGMGLYFLCRCLTKCFFLLATQLLFRLTCSSSLRSPPLSLNEIRGLSTPAAQKSIDRSGNGKHKRNGESHNLTMRNLILRP